MWQKTSTVVVTPTQKKIGDLTSDDIGKMVTITCEDARITGVLNTVTHRHWGESHVSVDLSAHNDWTHLLPINHLIEVGVTL